MPNGDLIQIRKSVPQDTSGLSAKRLLEELPRCASLGFPAADVLHSAHGKRQLQEGDSQEAEVRVSGGGAAAGCLCPQEAPGPWGGREWERGREREREVKERLTGTPG